MHNVQNIHVISRYHSIKNRIFTTVDKSIIPAGADDTFFDV